LLSENFQELP